MLRRRRKANLSEQVTSAQLLAHDAQQRTATALDMLDRSLQRREHLINELYQARQAWEEKDRSCRALSQRLHDAGVIIDNRSAEIESAMDRLRHMQQRFQEADQAAGQLRNQVEILGPLVNQLQATISGMEIEAAAKDDAIAQAHLALQQLAGQQSLANAEAVAATRRGNWPAPGPFSWSESEEPDLPAVLDKIIRQPDPLPPALPAEAMSSDRRLLPILPPERTSLPEPFEDTCDQAGLHPGRTCTWDDGKCCTPLIGAA